jgi:branched-chain amino acid transport system ATP-binding protein
MLVIENLHVKYRGIHALKGVSFEVRPQQIVALLGANGAGKSTTVRAISGVVPITSGLISFDGQPLNGKPAHAIQRMGLVQVPEGRKIFANLTVHENLVMGAYHVREKQRITQRMEEIFKVFPVLRAKKDARGGSLSGGQQQMLAIGRALMSQPRLLMMDEPSLGLAPMMVAEVFRVIQEIRERGITVLLIEQNADAALKIADEGLVLETGSIVLQGHGQELLHHPLIKQAYLGHAVADA